MTEKGQINKIYNTPDFLLIKISIALYLTKCQFKYHTMYFKSRFTRHTFNLMQASCRVSLDDLCMDNDSVYSLESFRTIVPKLNTMVALC